MRSTGNFMIIKHSKYITQNFFKSILSHFFWKSKKVDLIVNDWPTIPSVHFLDQCHSCRLCEAICPEQAIIITANEVKINSKKCNSCLLCVDYCPHKTITVSDQ